MTRLSPRAHALFEAANDASRILFNVRLRTEAVAVHEWLLAEIRFADDVGVGFVIAPKNDPQKNWQVQAYKSIARAMSEIRHCQFGNSIKAIA